LLTSDRPTFERTADAALDETRAIYSQRGAEYSDSWALENLVDTFTRSTLARFGVNLTDEQVRLLQLAALADVKDQRIGAGGPFKRDSYIDGLAYRAAYITLRAEYEETHPGGGPPVSAVQDRPCSG
jgi:hypothetical protein